MSSNLIRGSVGTEKKDGAVVSTAAFILKATFLGIFETWATKPPVVVHIIKEGRTDVFNRPRNQKVGLGTIPLTPNRLNPPFLLARRASTMFTSWQMRK